MRQLVYADHIYLNHTDRLEDTADLATIQQQIVALNPLAQITPVSFAKLPDLALLFQ